MTSHVTKAFAAVRAVADRPDPTLPMPVGELARRVGAGLSSTSRLAADLDRVGLLAREAYGTYRLGATAISLSGRTAAPYAAEVHYALTRAAQDTSETTCLAAPSPAGLQIVAAVNSAWTLHAHADVGTIVDDPASAIALAADQSEGQRDEVAESWCTQSLRGKTTEVATPVLAPDGEIVAIVAVRLPVYRVTQGLPRARRAVGAARRRIERALAQRLEAPHPTAESDATRAPLPAGASSLDAALAILTHLASGPDSVAGIAAATMLRTDRTQRLLTACAAAGVAVADGDQLYHLPWSVHGWHRAAAEPTLRVQGAPLVFETARQTNACAFLTVLDGMRSVTLVEELEILGQGLRMSPWLGRPHPIIGSDGGPTLVSDFDLDAIPALLPQRHSPREIADFVERVRRVRHDGVLTIESIEEFAITSVSAPVRDSSGLVAAAACIVGATEYIKPRLRQIERAARSLARRSSAVLCALEDEDHTLAGAAVD